MTTTASDAPVWFVTGCSTGLGREFARAALAHGFRVVATARDPLSIADLVKGKEGQAIALKLDVADPKAIAAAVHEAERVFGRIDVLINNAGYGYMAAVEEGEDAAIRATIRDQFLRPGGDDPRRPAGHAQAPPAAESSTSRQSAACAARRPAAITAPPSTR